MCGVAGMAHADGRPVDRDALAAMTDAMRHRGPDDRGAEVFSSVPGASAGLGHRRLSVIDLSAAGRQPMGGEDGAVQVVFNGEIYNFRELRTQLAHRGHVFRSATDTEVIVHAVEEWGADAVEHLDGMFAFAAWDARTGRLLLARDRFGKKPLYYFESGGTIAFASELTALLRHPAAPRAIDPEALSRYLLYEYVPAPHCMVAGVRKLPAAHRLVWRGGASEVSTYWRMGFGGNETLREQDAERELARLMTRAVERRLVSDVPLGVFLSGGVDSSALVSFMAEHVPARDIRTFCIGFPEADFDESAHARTVARAFGTRHSEKMLREADLIDVVPRALAALSEPMADASIVPTYLLSEFARGEVTVALGGDGGDELFAGYDPFAALGPARLAENVPAGLRALALRLVGLLPASERNMSLDFRLRQFLRGMDHPSAERNQAWLGAFLPREQAGLLHPDVAASLAGFDPMADVRTADAERRDADAVERSIRFYLRFYMAGHILPKVDAASMAHSLEVRAPFLDTELAEFACSLPSHMKLRGTARKWLLKRMLAPRLPEGILARPKKGFGIPLAKWLKGGLREMVEELLAPGALAEAGLFDPAAVRALVDGHMRGERDNRKQLWTLLCLQDWRRRHGIG